ncbi:MAG: hypothetical protein WED11_05985, partial [Natronospirillum sp.]
AYIKASNAGTADLFGASLALASDGNTLAVGAIGESSNASGVGGDQTSNTAYSAGATYVFTRSGGVWSQQAYIKPLNGTDYDYLGSDGYFGFSVALSADGDRLAVGAIGDNEVLTGIGGAPTYGAGGGTMGAVYVFTRSSGAWALENYVKASNTGQNAFFGHSVDLAADGNTMAVGAFGEGSNTTGVGGDQPGYLASTSGAVYLY